MAFLDVRHFVRKPLKHMHMPDTRTKCGIASIFVLLIHFRILNEKHFDFIETRVQQSNSNKPNKIKQLCQALTIFCYQSFMKLMANVAI